VNVYIVMSETMVVAVFKDSQTAQAFVKTSGVKDTSVTEMPLLGSESSGSLSEQLQQNLGRTFRPATWPTYLSDPTGTAGKPGAKYVRSDPMNPYMGNPNG